MEKRESGADCTDKLITACGLSAGEIRDHSFLTECVQKTWGFLVLKNTNMRTLQRLVTGKVITESMGYKIALSRLSYGHLQLVHSRGDLINLLKEKFDGKARVTVSGIILQSLELWFINVT